MRGVLCRGEVLEAVRHIQLGGCAVGDLHGGSPGKGKKTKHPVSLAAVDSLTPSPPLHRNSILKLSTQLFESPLVLQRRCAIEMTLFPAALLSTYVEVAMISSMAFASIGCHPLPDALLSAPVFELKELGYN